MPSEPCYLCKEPLPSGQSFYEDHEVKVCLQCFQTTPRCRKCKFPSQQLEIHPGLGPVCEFCRSTLNDTGMSCYLCDKSIPAWMSFYSDYDKTVCQECFAEADRCFLCRFPNSVKFVAGLGHVCEFCSDTLVGPETDLEGLLTPLRGFLAKYGHQAPETISFHWADWNLVAGMQSDKESQQKVKFYDEFLRVAYPVYYLNGKFYTLKQLPQSSFLVYVTSQWAAADICKKYHLKHLRGDSPFLSIARGWVHWIAFSTASILKYDKIKKQLGRRPEQLQEDFQRFDAMSEFRKPKEIVAAGQKLLLDYAKRYLTK